MEYLIIVLGIVIVIILFYLIQYYLFTKKPLVKEIHLSKNPPDVPSEEISNPNSILQTFSCWVYVNNFSNARLFSYTANNTSLFSLQLGGFNDGYSNKPTLRTMINGTNAVNGNNNVPIEIVISNNFPIQKWVHVLVSIDTTYVDCYLDGKLIISKPMVDQITNSPTSSPHITFLPPNGMTQSPDIYLTKLTRWDYPLDPQTVWTEYSSGNGRPNSKQFTIGVFSKTDDSLKKYNIYST
jgi:hypothetical protein